MADPNAERRDVAVVAIDVAGYSRLVAADAAGTRAALKSHRDAIAPIGAKHGGHVVGTTDHATLVAFPSAAAAVGFAIEAQATMAERNAEVPDARKILYRVGVNHEVLATARQAWAGNHDDSVARLAARADPGGVCLARTVYDEVRFHFKLEFDTVRDPRHTVFVCQEIRRKFDDLNLLEAGAVRIEPAVLAGQSGNPRHP